MYKKIKSAKSKRGFTLIELIVVIAVVAVLVLLAVPKFMGHIDKAKEAHIVNDVRVAENKVSEFLIGHGHEIGDISSRKVSSSDLDKIISDEDGKVFSREGEVNSIVSGTYSQLLDGFIREDVRSKLNGQFFTDEDGNAYYTNTEVESSLDDYTLAEDVDYKFVADEDAPFEYNGTKGYYQYIGTEEYVMIPRVIHNNIVKDYYKMFYNRQDIKLKGVSTQDSSSVVNMTYMFAESDLDNLEIGHLDISNVENVEYMFYMSTLDRVDFSGQHLNQVIEMYSMFESATIVNGISMKDMNIIGAGEEGLIGYQMFLDVTADNVDLSNTTIKNIGDLSALFIDSIIAKNIDMSKMELTGNRDYGANAYSMFINVKASSVNMNGTILNNFNGLGGTMFANATITNDINMSDMEIIGTANQGLSAHALFQGTKAGSVSLNGTNIENLDGMNSLFANAVITRDIDMSNMNISGVAGRTFDAYGLFPSVKARNVSLKNTNLDNVSGITGMFSGATIDNSIYMNNMTITGSKSSGLYANSLFDGTNSKSLDMSDVTLKNVGSMSRMMSSSRFTDSVDIRNVYIGSSPEDTDGFDAYGLFSSSYIHTMHLENVTMNNVSGLGSMFGGTEIDTLTLKNNEFNLIGEQIPLFEELFSESQIKNLITDIIK